MVTYKATRENSYQDNKEAREEVADKLGYSFLKSSQAKTKINLIKFMKTQIKTKFNFLLPLTRNNWAGRHNCIYHKLATLKNPENRKISEFKDSIEQEECQTCSLVTPESSSIGKMFLQGHISKILQNLKAFSHNVAA
jgi:hypothetical protein